MVELVALEIDLSSAEMLREPLGEIERTRPPDIMFQKLIELLLKAWIGLGCPICSLEFEDQRHQCLGDETTPVNSEESALVGPRAIGIWNVDAQAQTIP